MLRKIFLFVLIVLLVLLGVMSYNALTLQRRQVQVKALSPLKIDPKATERFAKALRFPTISYDDSSQIDYAPFDSLLLYIQKNYPEVHRQLRLEVIGGHSLLYTWKGSEAQRLPMAFMAHLDVVPIEGVTEESWYRMPKPVNGWKYPPFSGQIAEGNIWGRGALDDKLNVFGLLETAEMLLRKGFQPKQSIYFIFGHDEEVGGERGAKKIAARLLSQKIQLDFVMDEGLFILEDLVPGIQKPVAYIGVAEKGFVNLELCVPSEGGHSSRPPMETSIGILSKALVALEAHPFEAGIDGAAAETFNFLVPEMAFGYRMLLANQWLTGRLVKSQLVKKPAGNALLRTTIAPTMLEGSKKANVLPQNARAVVNFRIKPGETVQSVTERVKKVIKDKRVQIKLLNRGFEAGNPVPISDVRTESFRTMQKTIGQIYPEVLVAPSLMIAGTDSKHFQPLTKNIYRFSPIFLTEEELSGFHGRNERISIRNFQQTIRFYHQFIQNL